ncbi:hypothetical protein D9M68_683110 [compost metagenome]
MCRQTPRCPRQNPGCTRARSWTAMRPCRRWLPLQPNCRTRRRSRHSHRRWPWRGRRVGVPLVHRPDGTSPRAVPPRWRTTPSTQTVESSPVPAKTGCWRSPMRSSPVRGRNRRAGRNPPRPQHPWPRQPARAAQPARRSRTAPAKSGRQDHPLPLSSGMGFHTVSAAPAAASTMSSATADHQGQTGHLSTGMS